MNLLSTDAHKYPTDKHRYPSVKICENICVYLWKKIPYNEKESPYNPEFIKKVYDAGKDRKGASVLNSDEDIDNYFKNLESDTIVVVSVSGHY
ncbi:MAG: hypothetical protein K9G58_05970 [Bacteroidales bacterium]|nr:hypothetical protein [Bacteroidales bacterium]MCF8397693.1 hypothetical protein [Bacteroidales bacterium]